MSYEFRGWIDPNGAQFETGSGEDHGTHADRLLSRFYPSWKWEKCKTFTSNDSSTCYPSMALEYKGWVRVVCPCSFSVWRLDGDTKSILIELLSDEREDQKLHLDIHIGTHRRFNTVGDFLAAA